ncbi:MAG TPA: hypothetical protein VGJ87_17555 [Roseiflexaceae bacterium]|jgi:hypothetical protein
MGAIALDAQANDARAGGFEAFLVRTEPIQLERSDAAEVEQVPGHDHWTRGQKVGHRDRLAGRRWQAEERRAIADTEAFVLGHAYSVPPARHSAPSQAPPRFDCVQYATA